MVRSDNRKPSYDAVITAEYRLLNALAKKPEYFNNPKVSSNLFVDEVAKSIYEGIESLFNRNIPITEASLIQACNEIDFNVTNSEILKVLNIDSTGADTLEDIIPVLKNEINKKNIIELSEKLKKAAQKEGLLDVSSIQASCFDIETEVKKATRIDNDILSTEEMLDEYLEDIERRRSGKKHSFGDIYLDEHIVKGALPGRITSIVAATSMGKSTYGLNMMKNLMVNHEPCMYISLEMGMIDTIDRIILNMFEKMDNKTLYDPLELDGIVNIVEDMKVSLKDSKFCFCRATGVDTNKLRQLIREFKQKVNTDYALVMIDLVSGLSDYMTGARGGSTASSIELCMNRIEDIAKSENVHFVLIAQNNRQADSAAVNCPEDIERLRPNISDIKNSGAIAEKSTTVISLFRPKYYADRYLSKGVYENYVKELDDVLEATILKDRDTVAGTRFSYDFNGRNYMITGRRNEEDIEQLKRMKNKGFNIDNRKINRTDSSIDLLEDVDIDNI